MVVFYGVGNEEESEEMCVFHDFLRLFAVFDALIMNRPRIQEI